jgi:hypothetical protein
MSSIPALNQLLMDFKEMIRIREENHRLIEDLLIQRLQEEAKMVRMQFDILSNLS